MAFVLSTLSLCLGPLTLGESNCLAIRLPHRETHWTRDKALETTMPWSWNWILLEVDLQKKPQPQPHSLTATIWETWDISSAWILDPKQWSNKCLLTYYVQSNVLQSNKNEYTTALYLFSRCVTLDLDSQNVLSNERKEEKKLED